jgi:folate-dependent phosphoribosylglycinamide formyltransferase PurN
VPRPVRIEAGDDASTLAERILREEHVAYPEAVRLVLRGEATP